MADISPTLRAWSATAASNAPQDATTIGTGLDDNLRELQAVLRKFLASPASNMASAGTVDLSTADGFHIHITGTTSITALGTESAGIYYLLEFDNALTFTHHPSFIDLPGNANITTVAGDVALMLSKGSGNWKCVYYTRALTGPGHVSIASESADTTCFPLFSTASGGDVQPKVNTGWTFDSSTGNMTLTGSFMIGDTANANNPNGLTINQAGNDAHCLTLKSSDVATGLTTIVLSQDVETDDFCAIHKIAGATGGLWINGLAESTATIGVIIESYAGAPQTTDTTGSNAAITIDGAQHDGANALVDMAANSNLLAVREIDSGGSALCRMLLKADDGELHLGNTTLVALDDEEDALIIRAMQKTSSIQGIIESQWDNPFYNYDKLHQLGLAGEKDESGFFLFPLQPRLAAHEGAIWQTHCRTKELESQVSQLLTRMNQLEYRP